MVEKQKNPVYIYKCRVCRAPFGEVEVQMPPEMPVAEEVNEPQTEEITPAPECEGLMRFEKWWYRRSVEVRAGGETILGTPIIIEGGVMRLINEGYSYFVPLGKVDFIRTRDGYV